MQHTLATILVMFPRNQLTKLYAALQKGQIMTKMENIHHRWMITDFVHMNG